MEDNIVLMDCEERMEKSISSFAESLMKVKTGRASAGLVRDVEIDYWGTPTPLYQVSNISTPDATQIVIKPYDKNQLKEIEKSIINADLGFTPINDGTVIRCNIPQLTGETRAKLVKECYKMAENAKVAVRNIRRDAIAELKKDKSIPEDTERALEDDVQKLTDNATKKIDQLVKAKESELTTI
ncbi:MAG: ribosome recycling factor [Erysipelotrichaceae bacterium]|nr:ribosome recycling factor [Erysipelotrichaceae bacterium]